MMKAEITGSAVEFELSRGDALSVGLSILFVAILMAVASWEVAFVALGLSCFGAGAVDAVQRSDFKLHPVSRPLRD